MEVYKDLNNIVHKEFEKLLNSQHSKLKNIIEGKIVEGKISKVRYATKSLSSRLLKRKINRIKKAAPLVGGETINSKKLDDSIGLLNRFSRQNIQTVLVPEYGEIILEYRVRQRDETKIKSRFDNYGSERTGEYRVFGSLDNWNIFSVDDRLGLKALTSIDGDSSYYAADYSSPLDVTSSKRIAISGIYSKYNAQDVGLGASCKAFTLAGSIRSPSLLSMMPTYWTSVLPIKAFSGHMDRLCFLSTMMREPLVSY